MASTLAISSSPITHKPITTASCFSNNSYNTSTRIHRPHLKNGHSRPVLLSNRPSASAGAGHTVTDQTTQGRKGPLVNISERQLSKPQEGEEHAEDSRKHKQVEDEGTRFRDERWKKGTWDLNMFVNNGRLDWDTVITAGFGFINYPTDLPN